LVFSYPKTEEGSMITESVTDGNRYCQKWAPDYGILTQRFDPLKFGACFLYFQV